MATTRNTAQTKKTTFEVGDLVLKSWRPLLRLALFYRCYSQERTINQIVNECRAAEEFVTGGELSEDDTEQSDVGDPRNAAVPD